MESVLILLEHAADLEAEDLWGRVSILAAIDFVTNQSPSGHFTLPLQVTI